MSVPSHTVGQRPAPPLQWVGHLGIALYLIIVVISFVAILPIVPIIYLFAFAIGLQAGLDRRRSIHFAVLLILAIAALLPSIALFSFLYMKSAISNPLLSVPLFGLYLLGLGCLLSGMIGNTSWGWSNRRNRVREALCRILGLPASDEVAPEARRQVLALVPCKGRKLRGPLRKLRGRKYLWLCFLQDRLLAISERSGDHIELALHGLRRLYLEDSSSPHVFRLAIEDQGGAVSTLALTRLDDMVRVVNVLKQQGIVLGYRSPSPWIAWGRYQKIWSATRTLFLIELAVAMLITGIVILVNCMPPGKGKDNQAGASKGEKMVPVPGTERRRMDGGDRGGKNGSDPSRRAPGVNSSRKER